MEQERRAGRSSKAESGLSAGIDTPRNLRREVAITRGALVVTLAASALLAADLVRVLAERVSAGALAAVLEQGLFIAIAAALLYGNLVYQATRIGYLQRKRLHRSAPRTRLERVYDEASPPSLVILVPSYREERDVVRRTLLSAALQEHPRRRIVLLIDDPPDPETAAASTALAAMRRLPRELADLLEKPARTFEAALAGFLERQDEGALDRVWETALLAGLHSEASAWFEAEASNLPVVDAGSRLFAERILRGPAREHQARATRLEAAVRRVEPLDADLLLREHRRLASRFRMAITGFERKRYANLSHEPNKAMNLNAYLGLLGLSFREQERADGLHLEAVQGDRADLRIEAAEYVITLDADSVLAPDYALRLLQHMRAPDSERIAVIQTPYSAFPDAPGVLERVAGATTDVQYVIHQGFTRWDGTYWVGANALLRSEALRDLRTLRQERGHTVPVFIQDRTAIEDTESSVDLIARGWTLHNVPERLAWSATPPDFGALLIQRRRWANGGLLILPKLVRTLARGPWGWRKLAEGWVRIHYLVSIASVNASLLALLCWPFEDALRSLWFPLASLPYFALYGRELSRLGYPAGDLLRAYAMNLLLLPVQLAGVASSLVQALTGRKARFVRTPKVPGRTPAPARYHLAEAGLLALMLVALAADLADARWIHASFVAANGAALLYAVIRLVGPRQIREDLRLSWQPSHPIGTSSAALVDRTR
jgi:cellulose synthase/poly-beta-1,6-N-acetylglucosamine synthase-like glycosyltransferase